MKRKALCFPTPIVISMVGQIAQLVELIQAELRQNPESNSVSYLYSYLYSKLMDNCAAPSIRYLSEHYDLPITVNQLAEMENYNVTYYNDWFKQQTGCSPQSLPAAYPHRAGERTALKDPLFHDGHCHHGRLQQQFHLYPGFSQHYGNDAPNFSGKLTASTLLDKLTTKEN